MPRAPWVMTQTWHDLLFAHWPIDPARLRAHVPPSLDLDLHDGTAWLAVVPFRMSNVGPRAIPSLPGIAAFPELNVRTYVRIDDRPGVYFFSLDAASALAVRAARLLFNLPYYRACMTVDTAAARVAYRCSRMDGAAVFDADYEPSGQPFSPAAGTLEYFLTERYCLYHHDRRGAPYRLEIHHPPWALQPARARIARNTMIDAAGLGAGGAPVLLHFARRQDVVAWLPSRIE